MTVEGDVVVIEPDDDTSRLASTLLAMVLVGAFVLAVAAVLN